MVTNVEFFQCFQHPYSSKTNFSISILHPISDSLLVCFSTCKTKRPYCQIFHFKHYPFTQYSILYQLAFSYTNISTSIRSNKPNCTKVSTIYYSSYTKYTFPNHLLMSTLLPKLNYYTKCQDLRSIASNHFGTNLKYDTKL